MSDTNSPLNYEVFTSTVDSDKPFTLEEAEVMELLKKAMNKFVALPSQSMRTAKPFVDNIRTCQGILSMRTMRRLFPHYFIEED